MPPALVSVDAAAASALYFHLAEPAAQATDPCLSFVPSLSVVTAAAPAEYFAVERGAQVDEPAPLFAPRAESVDSAAASSAASPYHAELAAQANDLYLSPVPSLLVVVAAAPAECFAVKPVAQVDEPAPSFAPPAATVDLAAASDAAAPLAPSVDAAGYVDVASSTAHCHCEPYPAAVAAVSTNDPAPVEPF